MIDSKPSDKAVEAVMDAVTGVFGACSDVTASTILAAAHDPALGLERSVYLRDVVGALRDQGNDMDADGRIGFRKSLGRRELWDAADFIEREFGGSPTGSEMGGLDSPDKKTIELTSEQLEAVLDALSYYKLSDYGLGGKYRTSEEEEKVKRLDEADQILTEAS